MMGGIRHSKTAQNWARYEFSHFSGPETVQSMYVNSVGKIKLLSQWPKNGGPFRKTALTLMASLLAPMQIRLRQDLQMSPPQVRTEPKF